jgi:4-hydroxy-tetrahydrodipicolinate synthase
MVRLALAGDYAQALAIHDRFTELFELLCVDGNPAGVKSVLSILGYIENELRLPLTPARTVTYEKIREVMKGMKK